MRRNKKTKGRSHPSDPEKILRPRLERGLNLEAPGFEQRLGDVLRILVAPSPLAQPGRAQILVGGKLVLAHDLLKFGDGRGDRSDRFGLTPVWISASLGHENAFPL